MNNEKGKIEKLLTIAEKQWISITAQQRNKRN